MQVRILPPSLTFRKERMMSQIVMLIGAVAMISVGMVMLVATNSESGEAIVAGGVMLGFIGASLT